MNYNIIDSRLKKLIENEYLRNNIKSVHANDGDVIYIFPSSNGLYYPNDYLEFEKRILQDDKYEWENISKHIKNAKIFYYLRDIYKQWYTKGVNHNINSIDKIIDYYNNLIKNNRNDLITVGTSSGGYLSVILGIKLEAKMIFSFSGQFALEDMLNEKNTILTKYKDDNKYLNLDILLKNNTKSSIFYFVSDKSIVDENDLKFAMKYSQIKIFIFDNNLHGVPFFSFVLKYLLVKNKAEILDLHKKYNGKTINPIEFSIYICGKWNFIKEYLSYIKFKIYKKYFFKILDKGN